MANVKIPEFHIRRVMSELLDYRTFIRAEKAKRELNELANLAKLRLATMELDRHAIAQGVDNFGDGYVNAMQVINAYGYKPTPPDAAQ